MLKESWMNTSSKVVQLHIVITGGEPHLSDLVPLTEAFEQHGCRCQIETSGTSEVKATSDTCWQSPKVAMKAKLDILDSALVRANEIATPVGTAKISSNQMLFLLEPMFLQRRSLQFQPIS